ncbi:MAG: selenium cofactor biosynthesis protein YqeC [Anaerolineaceae bacterium]
MRVEENITIAFVGAGGKTTCMFQLARQFKNGAVVSTTTKLGLEQALLADTHFVWNEDIDNRLLLENSHQLLLVTAGPDEVSLHLIGMNSEQALALKDFCRINHLSLLIEADGARKAAFKAPADYEPVIPKWVEHVIVVAGLSALGKPISLPWIFRPERLAELIDVEIGTPLNLEMMCQVLRHPFGGLKGVSSSAQVTLLLNQEDVRPLLFHEERYIKENLYKNFDRVVVGSAWSEDSFRIL